MTKQYRIGVLGLTHDHIWGNLDALEKLDGGTLVAAADPNPPLLEQVRSRYGCAVYGDYEQMLEKESLDGVFIYSDNAAGVELAEMAAARGLAMMIEKPLASTFAGGRRAVAAARKANVPLMVNWPIAWWPQLQEAIHQARQGAVGKLWQVKYRAAHQGPKELGCSPYFWGWLYDRQRNGAGALMDYCCYGAALAAVLLGRPQQVTGMAGRLVKTDHDVDDNAVILMRYPGAIAMAEGSWSQWDKNTAYRPVFYGATGTLIAEPGKEGRLLLADADNPMGKPMAVSEPPAHLRSGSAHFLHVLRTGEPLYPMCDPQINLIAQQILQAGLDAAESGQAITLSDD
jgi:predicted dehydrogenase